MNELFHRRQIPLVLLLLTIVEAAAANWRFSNPRPHGNNILAMSAQNGLIWQVGDRGQVYTSADLDTWIPRETGTSRSLRGITFFQGKAFISAEAGGILTADSLDSYRLIDLLTENWLEGIAASPTAIVAVGDNGAIFSSADGSTWTPRGNFTSWLRSVAFGNNVFVAVGEDGFLATSTDGQSWDKRQLNTTAHLNKVEFIVDRFWVVGDGGTVLTNNARMTFVPVQLHRNVTNTLFAVAGSANEVVLAGDSVLLLGNLQTGMRTDQADASSPALAPLWPYYSALWDGRLFLVGGRTGLKVEGFRTNSTAPLQWYGEVQATREWLWSATRGPSFYAACGANGTIVTSEDGLDWHREVVPQTALNEVLLGIGGNSNALVAAGTAGTILRAPNVVTNTVSTNSTGQVVTNESSLFGVIWERSNSPTTEDLQGVAATSSTFVVAGGRGTLLTSADGLNWQPRTTGVTNFLSSVAVGAATWVVTGSAGAILTSPDAVTWSRVAAPVSTWIYAVRFVGGNFVAVGENGVILTSDDGASWTPRNSGTTEWLDDVTFARGTWYVAGTSGLVLSSPDLVTWSISRSITSKSLYAAATDGDQLVMAGLEGVILRQQLAAPTAPVNIASFDTDGAETLFLFLGLTGQRFWLEESSRVEGPWSPVETLEITEAGGTLIHPRPQAGLAKFFRTRLLE